MRIRGLDFPDDLYYHARHMVWIEQEPDGVVRLGLTALAPAVAGEILLFVAKAVGWSIDRDRSVGNVETGKLVSSVRTPVAGELVGVNEVVLENASVLNRSPYDAWLVRIRPASWGVDRLLLSSGDAARAEIEVVMDENGFGV